MLNKLVLNSVKQLENIWVCNDGKSQQVMYLIDEAENPGKVQTVSSACCATTSTSIATIVCLHADNCTTQNKNTTTIQFMMWRVMAGKQESIQLSFMLVGHTKPSPDWFFGLFKKVYRHSAVSTLTEIAGLVDRSTHDHQKFNIPQLNPGTGGETLVNFYEWTVPLITVFPTDENIW